MKSNTSLPRPKERDEKQRVSGVALAPSHAPDQPSFQVDRSETNDNNPKVEARSSAHMRKKTNKKECVHYCSDDSSEYDEEAHPGAYGIGGSQPENRPIDEDQQDCGLSNLVDCKVNATPMLVEAKLAPELTAAEEVNIQEEEEMIVKKKQYKRVLFFSMVFYGCAIMGCIASFVLLFVNPPPAFGRLYNPLWNGLVEAACFLVLATCVILVPTGLCCRSSIRLEEYAPDDKQLLRETQIASAASFCLFTFVAIPILVCLPNHQWLGYSIMTWVFAATVFAFSRVLQLRRSKENRQKTPKFAWVLFVLFFLGLTGVTIWRCLNPIYPDCNVQIAYMIGDGQCDEGNYRTEACGYDGGDCVKFLVEYPGCIVRYPSRIADGNCDGGTYNTIECGYDGGDCTNKNKDYPNCIVPNPSWIGNGNCDGRVYGTVECGFDGGDCLGFGERCRGHSDCASEVCNPSTQVCDSAIVSELYPNCSVAMLDWIGDGECDGGYYASELCGFDGGDCLKLGNACLLDEECASGFCNADTKVCYLGVLENYPNCIVEYPWRIGDGKCDVGAYVTEDCGYDGGDCLNPALLIFSGSSAHFPNFQLAAIAALAALASFKL